MYVFFHKGQVSHQFMNTNTNSVSKKMLDENVSYNETQVNICFSKNVQGMNKCSINEQISFSEQKTDKQESTIRYCCTIHLKLKKNNIFANVANSKGQTIIKFSSGLVRKDKNVSGKKQLRTMVKLIIEKISAFVKSNFDCAKIIINAPSTKSFSYFKEFKRKRVELIYFKSKIPVRHNGCRPPKKRRI